MPYSGQTKLVDLVELKVSLWACLEAVSQVTWFFCEAQDVWPDDLEDLVDLRPSGARDAMSVRATALKGFLRSSTGCGSCSCAMNSLKGYGRKAARLTTGHCMS